MRRLAFLLAAIPAFANPEPPTLADFSEMDKSVVGGADTHIQFYLLGYKEGFVSMMNALLADAGKDTDNIYKMYSKVYDCLSQENLEAVADAALNAAASKPDQLVTSWIVERYMRSCGEELAAVSYWLRQEDL